MKYVEMVGPQDENHILTFHGSTEAKIKKYYSSEQSECIGKELLPYPYLSLGEIARSPFLGAISILLNPHS